MRRFPSASEASLDAWKCNASPHCSPLPSLQVAPTALRGTLGSVTQICICSGIVIAQVVNLVLPTTSWRAMMALAAAPAVILFLGMFAICPESPRFLAAKGQREEARKAAVWLWGTSKAGDLKVRLPLQCSLLSSFVMPADRPFNAEGKMTRRRQGLGGGVQASPIDQQGTGQPSSFTGRPQLSVDSVLPPQGGADDAKSGGDSVPFAELFKGKNAKVALIAFMMFLFQQFSGVNAVFFYSGAVFKQVRVSSRRTLVRIVCMIEVRDWERQEKSLLSLGRKPGSLNGGMRGTRVILRLRVK